MSVLQKGVAEAKCVEACSAGHGPEKAAWDQACSGSICTVCSVELPNVFECESGIIRS